MAFPRQVEAIPRRSEHHLLETDVVYDEVRFYSRALAAPEVACLFGAGGSD